MRRGALWLGASLALARAGEAQGQAQDTSSVMPPTPASVRGRVIIPAGEKVNPAAGVMVTLHRVGPDAAGPLDSVRSGPDGRYSIDYTRRGSQEAVYFTAVVYRDIAYFSSPLRALRTPEQDGEIVVFDTTTHAMPFTIQGHHIVVSAPGPDGSRKVVEVYEVSNDTSVTVVGRDSLAAVWSAVLPRGATSFAGGQGDVAAASMVSHDGRAEMRAPFGPGIKQLSYSYALPPGAFPVTFTADRYTTVLEVLLEEEGAQARGTTLRAQENATTQGRTFKRFLAQGTPAGETVRIDVPVVAASTRTRVLVGLAIVIALAMIASLARALLRRGAGAGAGAALPAVRASEGLIAAIAALDARREAGDASLTADGYLSERAALKSALAAAMSQEQGG